MSQVKKLQSGGSLTIDGKKYDATPEFIQALSEYLHGYRDSAAPLAGLTAALQRGENVTYDSIGNTITGMKGNWAGIDEKAESKRQSGRSQWKRKWDATFNNDAHKFRNAVSLLAGFTYNTPTESVPTNQKDIYGDRTWFKWNDNNQLISDASENLGINARLDAMAKYLGMSEEDANKEYRLGD